MKRIALLVLLFHGLFQLFSDAVSAQLPWSNITLNGSSTSSPAAILRDGAVMQFPTPNGTRVVIVPTQPVTRVFLRRDCTGNGEVYAPHLMGLKVDAAWLAARSDFDWQGDEAGWDLSFPGEAFAPLVGQYGGGKGWLVADTDRAHCRVLYTRSRLALEYRFDPPIPRGERIELDAIVASVEAPDGRAAMNELLARWRSKVSDDLAYPELQPLHGAIDVQLEDQDLPLQHTARLLADFGGQFPRMMFWGWTSDRYSRTTPGTGCCLMSGTPHLRYGPFDDFLGMVKTLGVSPTIYFRSDDPSLDANLARWPAADRYIDVAGFDANVRRSYGSASTIIEGVTAACDHAGLISGSVTAGLARQPGGALAHESASPWFGRLVFDRRPLFLGDENYDWAWTDEATQFRTYRAAFLLGAKVTVRAPGKEIIQKIVAEWEASDFWAANAAYRDTQGIRSVPADVSVTRFFAETGKTILAVDRYYDPTWSSVKQCLVDGTLVTLPGKRLAIVEVP